MQTDATPSPSVGNNPEGEGKKPKKDAMQARVKAFCGSFQEVSREMFEDGEFFVAVPKSGILYNDIKQLIEQKASPEGIRLVFLDCWNAQDEDGTYWWRDPAHLTLKAFVKQYPARIASAKFKSKQAARKSNPEPPVIDTTKTLGGYKYFDFGNSHKTHAVAWAGGN